TYLARYFCEIVAASWIVLQEDSGFLCRLKDGLQGVVITLRDRVELVVMATSATDAQTEKHRSRGVDPVHERLNPIDVFDLVQHVPIRAHGVESGTGHRSWVVGVQLVPGDLLLYEAVIRLIRVEGIDDVV